MTNLKHILEVRFQLFLCYFEISRNNINSTGEVDDFLSVQINVESVADSSSDMFTKDPSTKYQISLFYSNFNVSIYNLFLDFNPISGNQNRFQASPTRRRDMSNLNLNGWQFQSIYSNSNSIKLANSNSVA